MTSVENSAQPSLNNHDSGSQQDGDHDSGVDESTQGKETLEESPTKPSSLGKSPSSSAKGIVAASPAKKVSPTTASTQSPAKAKVAGSTPSKTSATPTPPPQDKKLPMNKVVVGTSPSPNLKVVRSKIGSMENVKHRAGGGQVKMETKKIDLTNVKSKVGSTDNIQHKPTGGEKKVITRKLEWKAQSKVGSLDNAAHKPGGGTKKIEVQKVEFKDKAKPKVGSLDNVTHKPGGGEMKVEEHKLMFKECAKSKVGSMDYISHKPGGGNIQIFDEKTYFKQQQQYGSSKKSSLTSSDDHIEDHQSPSHPKAPSDADDSSKRLSQPNGDHAVDVDLKDATLGVADTEKKTEDGLDAAFSSKEIDVVNVPGIGGGGVGAAALQQPSEAISALEVGGK